MNNSNFDDIYKLFSISSITQLYQKHIWKTSCTHVKLAPQQVEVSISYMTKVGSKICWCYSYQIRATEIKYTYYIQQNIKEREGEGQIQTLDMYRQKNKTFPNMKLGAAL